MILDNKIEQSKHQGKISSFSNKAVKPAAKKMAYSLGNVWLKNLKGHQ